MNKAYEIKPSEFEAHMLNVFHSDHYEEGKFIFSKEAVICGLKVISIDALQIEVHLKEEAPYFSGKFSLQETLRKMQAVSSMLAIALDKFDL